MNKPRPKRAIANERLSGLIKQFWLQSGGVYEYRKSFSDLRVYGEHYGKNRVYRLLQAAGLRAQIGYRLADSRYWYGAGRDEGIESAEIILNAKPRLEL